jgi:hypothetical protein
MPEKTAYLRARAKVAAILASIARDSEVAKLLYEIAEEFEEEACQRELDSTRLRLR